MEHSFGPDSACGNLRLQVQLSIRLSLGDPLFTQSARNASNAVAGLICFLLLHNKLPAKPSS